MKGFLIATLRNICKFFRVVYYKLNKNIRNSINQFRTCNNYSKIVILTLSAITVYGFISFALHTVVTAIGIAINAYFINKIINLDGFNFKEITRDILSPVVGIIVFAISAFIYLVIPEITIILALFVLPMVYSDFADKFNKYDKLLKEV